MSNFKLTIYVMGLSTILLALFCKATDVSFLSDNETQWIYTALLVLIPIACANIALVWAVQRIGSIPTTIMRALEPFIAVVVGALALGEEFSLGQGIGIDVVLMAVLLPVISPLLMRRFRRA